VAQIAEQQLCKYKTLSSNLSTGKKNRATKVTTNWDDLKVKEAVELPNELFPGGYLFFNGTVVRPRFKETTRLMNYDNVLMKLPPQFPEFNKLSHHK
jgi:hypothetical protein